MRIGIARDRAFGFYYPDDLAAFKQAGADLIPFDTLQDTHLPPLDGIFIGGGFPECFLEPLSANTRLREEIKAFIEDGGPTYAECGGLMYLSRSIAWRDRKLPMVGVIPGDTKMWERPVGRGYMRFRATPDHPWPDVRATAGLVYNVHEFHYSSLEEIDFPLATAYAICGILGWPSDPASRRFRGIAVTVVMAGVSSRFLVGGSPAGIIGLAQLANGMLLPIVATFLVILVRHGRKKAHQRLDALTVSGMAIVVLVTLLSAVKIANVFQDWFLT